MSKHDSQQQGTPSPEIERTERIVQADGSPHDPIKNRPEYPRYRVEPGQPCTLREFDPDDTGGYSSRHGAEDELDTLRDRLETLQERLYAESKQSLLIVLQATDTGGKDGTIKHVFRGVNPQGCQVWSFKQPSADELAHDFLWRYHLKAPERGMMTIFNRSHYEDVLVVRVHNLVPEEVWQQRYEQINAFERLLVQNGMVILKFFLHISKDEQKSRFEARLDTPDKRWKFNGADLQERKRWDTYQTAYEAALTRCSTEYAPWYVAPSNHKWYRNLVVARTIVDTVEGMNPQYPKPADIAPKDIHIPE